MSSLFGDDISHHSADLFGSGTITSQDHNDPWSSNSTGLPFSVPTLLQGAPIPDIYNSSFNDLLKENSPNGSEQLKDEVPVFALEKFFDRLEFPIPVRKKIYSLINIEVNPIASNALIDRGTCNVAFALAAFVQKGTSEDNLSLNLVDFSRNSLPGLSFSNGHDQTLNVQTGIPDNNLHKNAPQQSQVWQSNINPSNYNPLSKNTISVSLVSKREGAFFFRHVNYIVEGFVPSSLLASINPTTSTSNSESLSSAQSSGFSSLSTSKFKVVRRYSDFYWLLESLQKKYPFRLLPILPPKRLSGMSYFLVF